MPTCHRHRLRCHSFVNDRAKVAVLRNSFCGLISPLSSSGPPLLLLLLPALCHSYFFLPERGGRGRGGEEEEALQCGRSVGLHPAPRARLRTIDRSILEWEEKTIELRRSEGAREWRGGTAEEQTEHRSNLATAEEKRRRDQVSQFSPEKRGGRGRSPSPSPWWPESVSQNWE